MDHQHFNVTHFTGNHPAQRPSPLLHSCSNLQARLENYVESSPKQTQWVQPSKLVVLPVLQVICLTAVLSIVGPQQLVRVLEALDVDAFGERGLPYASKKGPKDARPGKQAWGLLVPSAVMSPELVRKGLRPGLACRPEHEDESAEVSWFRDRLTSEGTGELCAACCSVGFGTAVRVPCSAVVPADAGSFGPSIMDWYSGNLGRCLLL